MAHKKGVGSSRNGRDSKPKFLGVKEFAGQYVSAGSIIVRQRGSEFDPGKNVGQGRDYTLYSLIDGYVKFEGKNKASRRVSVYATNPDQAQILPVGEPILVPDPNTATILPVGEPILVPDPNAA